jgi:putative ABC transport system ATP-binding protein
MDATGFDGIRLAARGRTLLEGFSLSLKPGEHCTLSGPSGSGKSTLLRCLLGFSVPESGEVYCLGRRVDAGSVWEIRRSVAWVAQEPGLGGETVHAALTAPFQYRANRDSNRNAERIPALMQRLRLEEALLAQPVDRLSGGEKQRVAVIAALLLERPVLLLDEASSALDPESRQALARLLRSMEETTILSVAHDPESFDIGGALVDLGSGGGSDGTH